MHATLGAIYGPGPAARARLLRAVSRSGVLILGEPTAFGARCAALLETAGFTVSRAANVEDAEALGLGRSCDLVLLEGLPDGGADLARCCEAGQLGEAPVLALGGGRGDLDGVLALELGADDWVSACAADREVMAKVTALMRRRLKRMSTARTGPVIHFSGWTLDHERRTLCRGHAVVARLTVTEYDLLTLFLANPGRVVTTEALLEASLARTKSVSSLAVKITRLRMKFGVREGRRMIRNVRSVGYVMDVSVGAELVASAA